MSHQYLYIKIIVSKINFEQKSSVISKQELDFLDIHTNMLQGEESGGVREERML